MCHIGRGGDRRHLRGLGPGHRLGSQPPRRPPAQVRLGRESLPRSTGASPMTRPSTSSSSSAASTRGGYARSARSSAGETSATTPRGAASSVPTRSSRFARRPLARPDRAAWCSKRLTNAGQRSVTADAGGGSGSGERTRCVPDRVVNTGVLADLEDPEKLRPDLSEGTRCSNRHLPCKS